MSHFSQRSKSSLKPKHVHSDYVFFFAYLQPQQKGEVLGMWSDAEELAKVNCEKK